MASLLGHCPQIEIKKADADMYVAIIDDKVTVKLGPRYDMGDLAPREVHFYFCISSASAYMMKTL